MSDCKPRDPDCKPIIKVFTNVNFIMMHLPTGTHENALIGISQCLAPCKRVRMGSTACSCFPLFYRKCSCYMQNWVFFV